MERMNPLEIAPRLLGALVLVLSVFGPWCKSARAEDETPACRSGLRLKVVQFDPLRAERSFAVFANAESRAQPLRRGARVAGYAIERIEQGQVILASQGQRCSVRVRGTPQARELRVISVAAVRGELRARKALAAN